MAEYRRLSKGLNDIGKLIPANENPYKYVTDTEVDWYLSVYKYNEDHKKSAEEMIEAINKKTKKPYKRARGIEGIEDVTTNMLVFDVDSKKDLEAARKDCIAICERLDSFGIPFNEQNISFSGGKGFSVAIKHDKDLTPDEHKAIAFGIARDLPTFDTVNYNASRIFRLNYTKHNSSNLYKTPISIEELIENSVEQIKNIASDGSYVPEEYVSTKLPLKIENLKNNKVETKKKKVEMVEVLGDELDIDFTKKPIYLTDLKYVLHCGYIPEGRGNEGRMILCSTYRHVGFTRKEAFEMLKIVEERRAQIYGISETPEHELEDQVIDTVYSSTWKGGTYTADNSTLLEEISNKFNLNTNSNVVGTKNLKDRFLKFAKDAGKNVIRTGIKELDRKVMLMPGMMVGLLAAPSAGKTSIAIKITEKQSMDDAPSSFLSMDMHDIFLTQRMLQRVTGKDYGTKIRMGIEGDALFNPDYNIEDDPEIEGDFEKFHEVFGNVDFDFTRGCTVEDIEENVKKSKLKHGDKFKVVVVDYLEKIRGPYSDATANSGYVASRLSDIATTYDVLVLLLLQPQKSAGDPSEPLLSMRKVKGASIIEQDCRVILTMWRPGFNPQDSSDDKFASIAVVKNNMGPITQLDFSWHGLKGDLNTLTESERNRLADILQKKEEDKKEDESW